MNFSNFKIGTRLYAGFGIVIAMTVLLLCIAYLNFNKSSEANRWNVHTYQVMGEVDAILTSLINIETGERGFALTGQDRSLEPYNAGKAAFDKNLQKARTLTSDNSAQQDRFQQLEKAQQQWITQAVDPTIKLRRAVNDGTEKIENVVLLMQAGKGKQGMDAMRSLLEQIREAESNLLVQRAKDAEVLQTQMTMTLTVGGTITAFIALMTALWLTRNITAPIQKAQYLAGEVAKGDLTVQMSSDARDETGEMLRALGKMTQSLVKIIGDVRTASDTIATGSAEIASGNQDLSSRTEQQASSLEETASSMEELTSTVKQNADNARQANQLAVSASGVAVKGGDVVAQVVTTMESINDSAKKIVDIIGVIDGIAFQTNILALNAAVEAARAGEQGRGFAVVASEVRNLAQRSAAAAKEIKGLIGDSVEKVDAGSKLVGQAGSTMNEIVESVKRVTDIMAEIMAASQEQSAGIEQVNQAISQMDQVTQQNAALVEEAAAAAESLQAQAGNLAQAVSVFKLNGMQVAQAPAQRAGRAVMQKVRQRNAASAVIAAPAKRKLAASAATGDGEWEQF